MSIQAVINNARDRLKMVAFAINQLKNTPRGSTANITALSNIFIFGRSVTFVVQNLRSHLIANEFDRWYYVIQEEMKKDELLNIFKDVRNHIEKQGNVNFHTQASVNFKTGDLLPLLSSRPPYAKALFMGDINGDITDNLDTKGVSIAF